MENLSSKSFAQLSAMVSNDQDRQIIDFIIDRVVSNEMEKEKKGENKLKNLKVRLAMLSEAIRKMQVNGNISDSTDLGNLAWCVRNYLKLITEKDSFSDLEVHISSDTDYKSGAEQYQDRIESMLSNISNLTKKGGKN